MSLNMEAKTPTLTGMNQKGNKCWKFTDNGETAELHIFGTIESEENWWEEDCTTYRSFIEELNGLGAKKAIHVSIHSTGGDVFAANAIYTALSMNPATITGTVIGICASAATIILMACDTRRIAKNAILMAHNPSVSLWGSYQADELLKMAEITNTVKKSIVTAYMERLEKTEDEISRLMDEESWYVGQEAVEAGFCDEVIETDIQNSVFSGKFMVNGVSYTFKNYLEQFVPEDIQKKVLGLSETKREAAGTFSNTNKIQKGYESMGEMTGAKVPEVKDVGELKRDYPELCAQLAEEAVREERERLKAIDEIAAGIPADLLEKAKYAEPVTAAELALAQMKADNSAGRKFMDDLESDLAGTGAAAVDGEPNVGYDLESQKKMENEQKVSRFAAKLRKDRRREEK